MPLLISKWSISTNILIQRHIFPYLVLSRILGFSGELAQVNRQGAERRGGVELGLTKRIKELGNRAGVVTLLDPHRSQEEQPAAGKL